MNVKEKITSALEAFQESVFDLTVISITDVGDAHFVVCDIDYFDPPIMRIPFVVYDGSDIPSVFAPWDWEEQLPEKAEDIGTIRWFAIPGGRDAVVLNGLPRLLAF